MANALRWWQTGVFYRVVVRSFYDTDGDGSGDLRGIIEKLDYFDWLGVDALVLSPFFPSPLKEFGFDVTDYKDVHPLYGSLQEFDRLLVAAHERGIKIVNEWVANHTSSEHPWFKEARSSRDNPRRDWYIWVDPRPDGSPPNNWTSTFGGSAWEWDEHTGQYYYHKFLKEQPDLNWRNPEVQEAMFDTLRYWLDRGVDGIRVDVLTRIIKDDQLRDNPPNPNFKEGDLPDMALKDIYTDDRPEVHDLVVQMRKVIDEYDDRLLSGEMYLTTEQVMSYYSEDPPKLHFPLNCRLGWTDWNADALTESINDFVDNLPSYGWPMWMTGNHDSTRIATRAAGEQKRIAGMLLMTLPGTLFVYYGEEIGMHDVDVPPDKIQDPQGVQTGRQRDPERTPMQWNESRYAGATTGEPWLPVADDYKAVNVSAEAKDPRSMLTLYRRLLAIRHREPVLTAGRFISLPRRDPVLAYRREDEQRNLLVVLNIGSEELTYDFPEGGRGRVLISSFLDRTGERVENSVRLRGDEGVIVHLTKGEPEEVSETGGD